MQKLCNNMQGKIESEECNYSPGIHLTIGLTTGILGLNPSEYLSTYFTSIFNRCFTLIFYRHECLAFLGPSENPSLNIINTLHIIKHTGVQPY